MVRRCSPAPLLGLLACYPDTPELPLPSELTSEASSEGWHEIDPPEPDPGEGDGAPPDLGSTTGGDSGDPEASIDAHLTLVEVVYDPDGTDGSLEGPEVVVLENFGPESFPLAALRLEARSWPVLDAQDLPAGAAAEHLDVGGQLRIERYTSDSGVSADFQSSDAGLLLRFVHASGLRNADGALLLFAADGTPSDLMCWGEVEQPEPFNDPAQWDGPCVPATGGEACRLDDDTHSALDWGPCP